MTDLQRHSLGLGERPALLLVDVQDVLDCITQLPALQP